MASLQPWLQGFGAASGELQLKVAEFVEWLVNGRPPWDAYRALMSGILVIMDNQPGVRPVRVAETWSRLMAKCILRVTRYKATVSCGMEQLDLGVEAGIERGIHDMRLLWEYHSQEEDWGFLFID